MRIPLTSTDLLTAATKIFRRAPLLSLTTLFLTRRLAPDHHAADL